MARAVWLQAVPLIQGMEAGLRLLIRTRVLGRDQDVHKQISNASQLRRIQQCTWPTICPCGQNP